MVGVFAAPAPFVGKLVGLRILPYLFPGHTLEQRVCDSLNSLSGVTDHFSSPDTPWSPLGSVIVSAGMEVFVCTLVVGFFHVSVGSPHVFSPLTSFPEECPQSLAADAQDQEAENDARGKVHPLAVTCC